MIAGRVLLTAVAGMVVLGLAACSAPVAAPRPSPTQVADTTPAIVTFTASEVSITTESGDVLDSFDYFTDAPTAVAALTGAFGAEPTTEHVEGLESPGYTRYEWTGFQLQSLDSGAEHYPPLRVSTLVTNVGDVLIATVDGISVGQTSDAIAADNPATTQQFSQPGGATYYAIELDATTITDAAGTTFPVYVGLSAEVGKALTSITAPQVASG